MTRDLVLGIWAALALLAVITETLARTGAVRWATVERFLRTIAQRRAVTLALALGWMWLGWHLFAR